MTGNPFARDPVRITIASERVTMPYPAAAWIGACRSDAGPPGALLALLAPEDRARTTMRLARGTLTAEEAATAVHEALRTAVPGPDTDPYPWWVPYRLLAMSADPTAAGRMLLAGLDPWVLTPAAWCYALYELLTQGLDAKQRFRFDAELKTPPAGAEDDDWGDMGFDQMVAAARSVPGMG